MLLLTGGGRDAFSGDVIVETRTKRGDPPGLLLRLRCNFLLRRLAVVCSHFAECRHLVVKLL